MKKLILLFAGIFLISACGPKTQKSLGIIKTTPDEYQVTRNKPLEVPPFYKPSTT